MKEIKVSKFTIEKSINPETGKWILFLHNSTKHGDCWRRIYKGSRRECFLKRNELIGKTL